MNIEGKNQVIEAIKNNVTINKIIIDKNFATRKDDVISLARKNKLKIEFLPKKLMDTKSVTGHHQGYIAETVEFEYSSVEEILEVAKTSENPPFVVLLDGIEDPHNLGAIIRTCECAGVHGIVIPKMRACGVNETVVRTSAGAISHMKIARVTNLKEAIDTLKDNGLWIYACEIGGEEIYSQNLTGPIGLVVGSEGNGIKQSLRTYCDGLVTLPLKGSVNSLNASVSAGIAIYEILRQRESAK
ncbi:MAG: 23S rRNA (guanosine(2251)-2'-O)-methyltransferase RlmB [Clostridia bacterium]|nr:23S rRNA (guanosine(2251)-2'-O)-methyltransferase RlmB [Clostridia bacterium]